MQPNPLSQSVHPDLENRVTILRFVGIALLAPGIPLGAIALSALAGVWVMQGFDRVPGGVALLLSSSALIWTGYHFAFRKVRWHRRATWVFKNVPPVDRQIKLGAAHGRGYSNLLSFLEKPDNTMSGWVWWVELEPPPAPTGFLALRSNPTKYWIVPPNTEVAQMLGENLSELVTSIQLKISGAIIGDRFPAKAYVDSDPCGPVVIQTSKGLLWPDLAIARAFPV